MTQFDHRFELLAHSKQPLLTQLMRGIEKESLRVTPEGKLAQTPHPRALGSTLTHPKITTDFSESLLEFITPPSTNADAILGVLDNIHRFTYQHIGDELLWANSMPCQLSGDSDIPVGQYGSSNIGQMKTVYRLGLGHRYGRLMQTIAGIHYNFSLPTSCWELLYQQATTGTTMQDFITQQYFALIRNFRRHFWLLLYLFGASPGVCRSFVKGREHQLQPFGEDTHSLHAPQATSLRMGNLGYQSNAQNDLVVCYNNLRNYITTLRTALVAPYHDYESIGLKDSQGHFKQLSTHLLQIENEFYSTIRPKRTTNSGETPLSGLWQRGVEYIEVRCIDLNPFLPLGIDRQQIDFLDIFLLHCLLQHSPESNDQEYRDILNNQHNTVYRGRDTQLMLRDGEQQRTVKEWASTLFEQMQPVAALMDQHQDMAGQAPRYEKVLNSLHPRITNPDTTPSAQILSAMQTTGRTYYRVAMDQALQHREYFTSRSLDAQTTQHFNELAEQSLIKQQQIEASDTMTFDQFLHQYYQQYRFEL